jgi:hypothetical protein
MVWTNAGADRCPPAIDAPWLQRRPVPAPLSTPNTIETLSSHSWADLAQNREAVGKRKLILEEITEILERFLV